MQQTHTIGSTCNAQAHNGHIEDAWITAFVTLSAQRKDAINGNAIGRVIPAESFCNKVYWEAVDTCRNWGVRGEHRSSTHSFEGFVIRKPLIRLHEFANALKAQESCVTFIGMEHFRSWNTSDSAVSAKRTNATNTQQHFLMQPMLSATAIQAISDFAFSRSIFFNI